MIICLGDLNTVHFTREREQNARIHQCHHKKKTNETDWYISIMKEFLNFIFNFV